MKDHDPELSAECKKLIECDTARISKAGDKLFLLIGFNKSTKEDPGRCYQVDKDGNYIARDWNYVEEYCVAFGSTEGELIDSAKEYQRLCNMTMDEYLSEIAGIKKKII
jgi:hypothetical protein